MIDFTEIPDDGEVWELFARDFLQEIGSFIASPPDREPDAGKDLLVTEELKGNLGKYKLRWLVSCKHLSILRTAIDQFGRVTNPTYGKDWRHLTQMVS